MYSRNSFAALLFLISLTAILAPRANAFAPQAKQEKGSTAWSGCVDEQSGQYVLLDDRSMKPVADLSADGFPTEGFAKYLGHKVTVRGRSTPGSNRPLIKVRSIETVSEICAPKPQ